MNGDAKRNTRDESPVPPLMLFVTGNAPRSQRARENLAAALESLGLDTVKPLEIDLLSHPEYTVTYSVFATPALLRTGEDGYRQVLYGDLSDKAKLKNFLRSLSDD